MSDPEELIKKLNMISHPEGGYFVESFRDKENNVSLIYYLLKKNQRSHWHRLKKNEILHFYQGDPMLVYVSEDGLTSNTLSLGNDINNSGNIPILKTDSNNTQLVLYNAELGNEGIITARKNPYEGELRLEIVND